MINIQPFQETLNAGMCGPASLKMVLAYWGIEKPESELAELCHTDSDLGTSIESMKQVAEELGMLTKIKNKATLEDIQSFLDKGIPPIVNWFTRGRSDYSDSEVPDGHYSVVVDLDDTHIYLQDPEIGGLRKLERHDFMKVWFDFTGEYIASWEEMIIRQIFVVYPSTK